MTEMNLAYFKEREGETYEVAVTEGDAYPVQITSVKPKANPIEGWESFTVYFQGPKHGMLPQQTIPLKKADEEISIFMVPIEETEAHYVYESVFNLKLENS